MNRIDRLFGILLSLQNQSPIRAQDLADKFEISKRTVYRDIVALSEMGVPVVSLPGEGYELMPGFYLPPLIFTPAEASALVLGAKMLTQQADGTLPADAENALAKIVALLPDDARQQVERLTEIIHFILPQKRFNLDDPWLVTLQQAILDRCVVYIHYQAYDRNEITKRQFEPHWLFYSNTVWYVSGYCRLRQADRCFRLDRIDHLVQLPETFSPRDLSWETTASIIAQVRFAPDAIRWVRERQHYGYQSEEPPNEVGIVMTYQVDALGELIPWLLGWGAKAEVLSPPKLRQKIRQEAQKLVDMLT